MMNFGNKLKALIEENNLTQKQLAAQLNIAPSTVSSYVQNVREPDFATLKAIALYFDVSLDYLFSMPDKKGGGYMENDLLRIFHLMTEEQKEMFIEQGKVFVRANTKQKQQAKSS